MSTPYVYTFSRDEFLAERWVYRAGEHVTILAPTDGGKTTLAYELLSQVSTPDLPAISLVMKPRDPVVSSRARAHRYRTVRTWPPLYSPWHPWPPGYVLWPKHSFDPDSDNRMLYRQFRAAILDSYKRGNRILFADELWGLTEELGLDRELVTVWTRGRSMGCGLWGATQKPSHIPLHGYSQAAHLFLGYDPDKRNRQRFSEIGGVEPKLVSDTVMGLRKFQWLYIRRHGIAGPELCIVDK